MSQESYQFIIDDSLGGIWGRGWGGVGPRGGGVRLAQYKKFGMVLGMVFLPLEARRSLFPDWPCLCDESSPVTTQKGSAHSCSNFGRKIQKGVPFNN